MLIDYLSESIENNIAESVQLERKIAYQKIMRWYCSVFESQTAIDKIKELFLQDKNFVQLFGTDTSSWQSNLEDYLNAQESLEQIKQLINLEVSNYENMYEMTTILLKKSSIKVFYNDTKSIAGFIDKISDSSIPLEQLPTVFNTHLKVTDIQKAWLFNYPSLESARSIEQQFLSQPNQTSVCTHWALTTLQSIWDKRNDLTTIEDLTRFKICLLAMFKLITVFGEEDE